MVHRLKVAKHGVLGGWLVEIPQLQKEDKCDARHIREERSNKRSKATQEQNHLI